MTRRDFGGIALGAAAQLGRAQDPGHKIGFAMVGLGRISMQHLAPSLKTSTKCKVTALVSGHRDKAEKMAAEYGIPAKNIYSYENYDAIADNKDIDAVYVALPNSMHYPAKFPSRHLVYLLTNSTLSSGQVVISLRSSHHGTQ